MSAVKKLAGLLALLALTCRHSNGPSLAYCFYLLLSANSRTYTGITTDLQRRLRQHNGEIKNGAAATRAGRPWRVVFSAEGFADRGQALQFEYSARRSESGSMVSGLQPRCDNLRRLLNTSKWASSQLKVSWYPTS